MSTSFPPESDLAPFTRWGISVGDPVNQEFQWCDLAEDGLTQVPYPIPAETEIELRVTWEGGSILLGTVSGGIVKDPDQVARPGFFLAEMTAEQTLLWPADKPVLFRFRSTYEGQPMTILRGEIYSDRETA